MGTLKNDICSFLMDKGFSPTHKVIENQDFILTPIPNSEEIRYILPISIKATSPAIAEAEAERISEAVRYLETTTGCRPMMIAEDRWNRQQDMIRHRILAHLESFFPIYARNCDVKKIDKETASEFLESNHSYGDAACRYRYGVFLKRHTGHINCDLRKEVFDPGTLVAVAEFSNARKWTKGDKTIRSYEWTRFASVPDVRIVGGMGKVLNTFIDEVGPDDIMSYSDLEWSDGNVYSRLGFVAEGDRPSVMFRIDKEWRRQPIRKDDTEDPAAGGMLYFKNFGSRKYRLKLTDYK